MGDEQPQNSGDVVEEILTLINKRRWFLILCDIYLETIKYEKSDKINRIWFDQIN
jgi:hypothetical protein